MARTTINIDKELNKKLTIVSVMTGISKEKYINKIIWEAIETKWNKIKKLRFK